MNDIRDTAGTAALAPNAGRPIRVVVTKVGLDGHDRGVKVIAQALRDAGMEVVYAGLRRTPEEIARIVLEEDADVLGLSILSGAVLPLTRRTREALNAQGLDDVLVVVGGIVPKELIKDLNDLGVGGVFGPGTLLADVIKYIRDNVPEERAL